MRGRRRAPAVLAWATAFAAAAVALFAAMHGGPGGEAFCVTGTGGLSWWPPGAECSGATDAPEDVRLDPAYPVVLLVFVWPLTGWLCFGLGRLVRRRRAGSSQRRPARPAARP